MVWLTLVRVLRGPSFSILTKSGRSQTHSKPAQGASSAQIVMHHPSSTRGMTQTSRQKHSATMVVRICGVANLGAGFAWAKFFGDFDQIWAVSDTLKARSRCILSTNCDVPPFKHTGHDPNKQTKALSNSGCVNLWCG